MKDEGMVALDSDELGQLLLLLLHVDVRVAVVVEDPEEPVDPHVHARRLQKRVVIRVDLDPALRQQAGDGRVGENHVAIVTGTATARPGPSLSWSDGCASCNRAENGGSRPALAGDPGAQGRRRRER